MLSSSLLATAPDDRSRALFLASKDEWAHCWTSLRPSTNPADRRTFTAPQYRVLSCVSLGLTPGELVGAGPCPCGDRAGGVSGVLMDHLLCHKSGSQIRRHDEWALLWRELFELAGSRIRYEPRGLFAAYHVDGGGGADPHPQTDADLQTNERQCRGLACGWCMMR